MALTDEEIKELKDQLREQVKDLPQQQKEAALKQIDELSPGALETMIKQQQSKEGPQKGVFRSIIDGEIKSHIIAENKDALAVLDIKPISKGHVIIIPKKPASDTKSLPNSCFNLSKKIIKKISKKLNAKSSEIQTEYKFGEIIINVIPIYDKPLNINSPRHDAKPAELEEIESKLKIIKKQRIKKIKIKPENKESFVLKLPRRIP